MNGALMPSFGVYIYFKISEKTLKEYLGNKDFVSAIGHQSTADILSEILGIEIPYNRITVNLKDKDEVIVFKLKKRPPEGKILTKEEIEEIGYEFGYYKYYSSFLTPHKGD